MRLSGTGVWVEVIQPWRRLSYSARKRSRILRLARTLHRECTTRGTVHCPPTNDIASLLIVAAAFVFIGWATSSYLIGACTGSASLPAQFHVLVRKKECMAIPVDSPKMHAGRIAAEKSVIRSAWGRWDLRQQLPPSSGPSDSSAGTTDALSTFARVNFFFGRPCSLGCMHLMRTKRLCLDNASDNGGARKN